MKLRNLLYATFAMTMVACSQENSFLSQDETGVLRTISSGSGKFASRSVVDSKWEQGDAIGVFMLKSEDASSYSSQDNVKFINNETTANTKVTFTSETGITLVNDKVKFHAYYPWSDTNVTGTTYNVQISDQTELTNVSNSDLRWAESEEKDLTNGALDGLSLNFAHKLTFLKVKTNVADVKSVSVSGVNTEAQFNIVDGTLSGETGNTKSIQLCKTTIDEQTVYCGIVVPTTELKGFVIKIVATEEGKDMVYQYVYGDNTTLEGGLKGGWQYLFNITLEGSTGSATLDKIEAELGGFEGESSVNGEVSDPQEAVTDITVPAGTNLDGLNALLADKSGKVSLNFADGTYDLSGKGSVEGVGRVGLEFPEAITGINFVGSDASKVTLNIAYLRWPGDLQELKFKNVKVESNGSDYFIYTHIPVDENGDLIEDYTSGEDYSSATDKRSCRFAEGGVIEIDGCYFHNTKRIFRWATAGGVSITNNKLSLISITNSRMEGTNESLFEKHNASNVVLKESTFYNWSNVASTGNTDAVFDVQNCTFAKVSNRLIYKGYITFNNNIAVEITNGLVEGTITAASNNYGETGATLGNLTETTNITLMALADIFGDRYTTGTTTIGNNTFVPESGITAGDPRWLSASTGE